LIGVDDEVEEAFAIVAEINFVKEAVNNKTNVTKNNNNTVFTKTCAENVTRIPYSLPLWFKNEW
jgi:hypothetical protein